MVSSTTMVWSTVVMNILVVMGISLTMINTTTTTITTTMGGGGFFVDAKQFRIVHNKLLFYYNNMLF